MAPALKKKRVRPKSVRRARKNGMAWNAPKLRLLLKRDKRTVEKISKDELGSL